MQVLRGGRRSRRSTSQSLKAQDRAGKQPLKGVLRSRFKGRDGSGNYPGLRCDWCDMLIMRASDGVVHWLEADRNESRNKQGWRRDGEWVIEVIHHTHLGTASPHAKWMELTTWLALLVHNLKLSPDELGRRVNDAQLVVAPRQRSSAPGKKGTQDAAPTGRDK